MSLSERLNSARPAGAGIPCPVSVLYASVSDEDRAALDRQMTLSPGHPERLSAPDISKILAEEGFQISPRGIERHRRGGCRCFMGTPKRLTNDDK